MALINCPECGKEVSDTAKKCIHCGYKLSYTHKSVKLKITHVISAAGIFIITMLILCFSSFGMSDRHDSKELKDIREKYSGLDEQIDDIQKKVNYLNGELENIQSGGRLEEVYEIWADLAERQDSLSESEKLALKLYAEELIELCPDAAPYIDEDGRMIEK